MIIPAITPAATAQKPRTKTSSMSVKPERSFFFRFFIYSFLMWLRTGRWVVWKSPVGIYSNKSYHKSLGNVTTPYATLRVANGAMEVLPTIGYRHPPALNSFGRDRFYFLKFCVITALETVAERMKHMIWITHPYHITHAEHELFVTLVKQSPTTKLIPDFSPAQ